jgi:hypothetical protein
MGVGRSGVGVSGMFLLVITFVSIILGCLLAFGDFTEFRASLG